MKIYLACLLGWMVAVLPVRAAAPVSATLGSYAQGFAGPARLATGPEGQAYVVDSRAGRVLTFDAFGRFCGEKAGLGGPLGIAVDAQGRIYLGEEQPGSVSVFDAGWNLLYKLGKGDGEFAMPNYIAVDGGRAYVADSRANVIKAYDGSAAAGQFGAAGAENGQFDFPAGICLSTNGEVFVVDQNNDRVQVFDREGAYKRKFKFGGMLGPSGRKQGAAVDANGRLYVADAYQGVIRVYDAVTGSSVAAIGAFGERSGQLAGPAGIALDCFNRLLVASCNSSRVEIFGLDSYVHLSVSPPAGVVAEGAALVFTALVGGGGSSSLQWRWNGTDIEGATNASLSIDAAAINDAGGYSVVISGAAGSLTSGVAQVSIMAPPRILGAPQSLAVLRGTNVEFVVGTSGDALRYQWLYNGRELDGETRSMLALSDVQVPQAGAYAVRVWNDVGSVISTPALLDVTVPPQVLEFATPLSDPDPAYHLLVNSDPGFDYAIDASTDLTAWAVWTNFTSSGGLAEFVDGSSTNFPNRFYRVRWTPWIAP